MGKKLLIVSILFIFTGLFFWQCKKNQVTDTAVEQVTKAEEMTLVFARGADSVSLDPGREMDGESFYGTAQIFDTLVEFKPGTTELQPSLAKSWDISEDGKTFTFQLVEGATFHDGTLVDAEAVVFSFERQYNEEHPYYKHGPWKYWTGMDMGNIVDSVSAVDETTVKFSLKKVEAPFLANLAMDFASIVSPTAAMKYEQDFATNPVGSGPFVFHSWTKNDSIIYKKNVNYWRTPAKIDTLIIKVIPDATARYLALQKGEVDLIDFPSVEDFAAMKADPNIVLQQRPGLNVGYMAMNTKEKPFDDVRVRQAINFAINQDEIIAGVYGEAGIAAHNPLPPIMWGYNEEIEPYPYDPEKAKALLAEAGLADGFKTDLWAMPVARPYNPNGKKVAEIIQAQLVKVGIEAEIVSMDWGTYLEKTANGEHQMALLGWTGDNGDPDNFLHYLLSIVAAQTPNAGNISLWENQEFDDLLTAAKENLDFGERSRLYKQAQVIFHEEVPWVPIAHSLVTLPMNSKVKGFDFYPTGKRLFYRVYLED